MSRIQTGDGRQRVVVEGVSPAVDGGRFPIKRVLHDLITVEADIFADGHDVLSAVLQYKTAESAAWEEVRMEPLVNDRWQGRFAPSGIGTYLYRIEAWIDHFRSWRRDLEKKFRAGLDVSVEVASGVEYLRPAMHKAGGTEAEELRRTAEMLSLESPLPVQGKVAAALSPRIAELLEQFGERKSATRHPIEFRVVVDRRLAEFGAWYELFPRSTSSQTGQHGTLKDCEAWLPRLAEMGFDVVYLPPIHPIGKSFRKGRNNSLASSPGDPGSPWAIGGSEGGHKSIHPQLGTLEDFRSLLARAKSLQMEIALDIALQCSPDHPYVRDHPEWFRKRADGTIQYAENPPKKYQDIYPFDFESPDWESLWQELKSIFEFWIEQGVSVFRVDNPHTKPFRFWEWCISELKRSRPSLIFLAEAFTRPKVLQNLAKLGFTQSYNYFPWRNTKHELTEYLTHLTQSEVNEYLRPSLWPNTPDILTEYLRYGGRPAFMSRLVLAATLGATYGIYGPAYEVAENEPREPGSEEYLNSEKYEVRHWKLDGPGTLGPLMTKLNRIRREHRALQSNRSLQFHTVDNEQIIAYSKRDDGGQDFILTVVNLDPHHVQRGWVTLPLEQWGFAAAYQVHELLTDARYLWSGPRNFVELDPQFVPAHVLVLRRYVRTEHDFDYFM